MNVKIYDRIETIVDIEDKFSKRLIPKGTIGTVTEYYERPKQAYGVDLKIKDEAAFGGYDYENVLLYQDQFQVVHQTAEEEHLKSVYQDIDYQVTQITPDDSQFVTESKKTQLD
ncbi:MAG: DUF4926 domain-containing protein [Cyanobacteriota bacterium]|nr:DUF4926 domain-containing protein [Cyanobacteriota bacterium]